MAREAGKLQGKWKHSSPREPGGALASSCCSCWPSLPPAALLGPFESAAAPAAAAAPWSLPLPLSALLWRRDAAPPPPPDAWGWLGCRCCLSAPLEASCGPPSSMASAAAASNLTTASGRGRAEEGWRLACPGSSGERFGCIACQMRCCSSAVCEVLGAACIADSCCCRLGSVLQAPKRARPTPRRALWDCARLSTVLLAPCCCCARCSCVVCLGISLAAAAATPTTGELAVLVAGASRW